MHLTLLRPKQLKVQAQVSRNFFAVIEHDLEPLHQLTSDTSGDVSQDVVECESCFSSVGPSFKSRFGETVCHSTLPN